MTRCILQPATTLSFSDCSSWISRPDTKYKNLWTQTFDRYILFSLRTIFAQCASSSSSTLKKWELITWNLGQIFEIKLWMVGQLHRRWVFTWADCSKNLQIENRNSFCQDWWLHGLQHRISLNSFATDCAANFDCNQFRIAPDIVSKLLRAAIWSRSIRIWADALFLQDSIRNMWFCFYVRFLTQKPMTDRKIQRSNERVFGRQQLLANSIENFISHEKGSHSSRPDIYKALKPCWLSNWVSITRVVACFPQASLSRPAATAAD